jgi:hypothetical protein
MSLKGKYIMKNSTMNIAAIIANPSIVDQKTFNFEEINANKATLSRRFDMMMAKIKFLVKQNLIDTENLSTVFNNVTGTIKGTFDEMDVIKDDKIIGGFCFQNGGFVEGGESYFWTTNKDETRNVTFFTNCNEMKKQLKENAEMIELIRATFNPDYVEPVVEEKPAKVKKEKTVKKAKFVEVDDLDADIPAKRTRKKETKVEEIATVDNVEEIEVIA